MDYSNPKTPDGINVTNTHPAKEFLFLIIAVFGVLLAIILLFGVIADKFAHYIPYSVEADIPFFEESDNHKSPLSIYLQTLADRIASVEQLPEEMQIKIHLSNEEKVNAFATLGGHIVFYRGLLEEIPNENALAMVIAHEVAHIKHRHPIRSVGRGAVIGVVVTLLDTSLGNDIIGSSVGNAGRMTQLRFSRDHETEADETALLAMQQLYGHVEGATDLFDILKADRDRIRIPDFLNTHPAVDSRIQRIREYAQKPEQTTRRTLTSLPGDFQKWLAMEAATPKT